MSYSKVVCPAIKQCIECVKSGCNWYFSFGNSGFQICGRGLITGDDDKYYVIPPGAEIHCPISYYRVVPTEAPIVVESPSSEDNRILMIGILIFILFLVIIAILILCVWGFRENRRATTDPPIYHISGSRNEEGMLINGETYDNNI